MQLGGNPERVRLTVDLTRYDSRCVIGALGTTIPNHKVSMWGAYDTFTAIRFDNGPTLDIVNTSFEYVKQAENNFVY